MQRKTTTGYFAGLSRNTSCSPSRACSPTSRPRCLSGPADVPHANAESERQRRGPGGRDSQATQNIVQGFSGWLSDRLQRRKPIALAGYSLAAIAKPLMGLATAWPGVLGGRFLDRLGAGTRTAPRDALHCRVGR